MTYNPYYDEVKERNALKAGARGKKNGSRSHRCTLPSDNLTTAQKQKLNGPVKQYELHKSMSWEEFKELPTDLQQVHVDYIQRRFRIGPATISQSVFGRSDDCLWKHSQSTGLTYNTFRGRKLNDKERRALLDWVDGTGETQAAETNAETQSMETPARETQAAPCGALHRILTSCTAQMSGTAEELLLALGELLSGRDATLDIAITYGKGEKNCEN